MEPELSAVIETVDSSRVLRVSGEIDVSSSPKLQESLVLALDGDAPSLVVDLSEVTFIDSTGVGVLVSALKRCRNGGGELRLVVTHANVLKVLQITGLTEVFSIYDSDRAAIEALGAE